MKKDIDDGPHDRAESDGDASTGVVRADGGSDRPALPPAPADEPTKELSLAQRIKGKAASMRDMMAAAVQKPAVAKTDRPTRGGLAAALTPHRLIVIASVAAALVVGGVLWVALDAVDPLPPKPIASTANTTAKPADADKKPAPGAAANQPPAATPAAPQPPASQPIPMRPPPPPSVVRQMDTQPLAAVRQYAEAGEPTAQMELGRRYYRGIGVEKSDSEAAKWIERAAEQGDPNAEFNVGVLYEQGLGVARDVPKAMEWYKKAAARGMPLAMHNMAMAQHRGEGVPRNLPEVRRLLVEAAELGLIQSQFSLALVYEQGVGGPVDKVRALAWMSLAARSNDPQIVDRMQKMSAASLPSDVEQGQTLAVQLAARIVENRRNQDARNDVKPGDASTRLPSAPPPGPPNMPSLSNVQPPPPGSAKTAPAKPDAADKPADKTTVIEAQRLLSALKLYSGPINGNFGPLTEKAVREFQAMSDLPANGAITSETMGVLREVAAAAGQPKRR